MNNNTKTSPYVVVRNGKVELRRTNFSGPVHVFADGAVSAVLTNDVIIVTFKNGRICEYRLSASGTSALLVKNIA